MRNFTPRTYMKRYAFACVAILISFTILPKSGISQVANYAFSQTNGTYTNLATTSGFTNINFANSPGWDDDVISTSLPFTFNFNGAAFTSIYISSNGFISFGSTAPSTTNYSPISTTGSSGIISAVGKDIGYRSGTAGTNCSWNSGSPIISGITTPPPIGTVLTGSISGIPTGATVIATTANTITMNVNATASRTGRTVNYYSGVLTQTTGNTPNRKFYIQWTWADAFIGNTQLGSNLNYQIVLNETTDEVNVVYGSIVPNSNSNLTPQVGLRGANTSDYNNRTGSVWSTSTAGAANNVTMTLTNSSIPASGQIYTWAAPKIITGSISGSPFCVTAASGTTVSVPFTSTGTFAANNTYTAQLSSAGGSFATPTNIGTLPNSNVNSGTITATIPAGTLTGTGYRIRVISSNPAVTGSDNGANLTINLAANSIAPIAVQNLGVGVNGTTLTVTEQSASTSRGWYYSTTSGGPYTTSLSVPGTSYTPNFATQGTYYVVCISNFSCGTITSNQVQINVSPTISTAPISGSPFCAGSTINVSFSSTGTYSGNTYTAQLSSAGGSFASPTNIGFIVSDANSGTINATIPAGTLFGTGYRIRVVSNNPVVTGTDNGSNLTINVPAVINNQPANTSTCPGTAKTFSVTLSSGTSPTYQWQYSADGSTGWGNVVNGTPANFTYTNSTTATLSVSPNASATPGTYYYRCIITVSGCSLTTSDPASLLVNPLPTTSTAGSNQILCSTSGTTTLAANTPVVGTGAWSVDAGSPNTSLAQFGNVNSPTSSFTPAGGAGVYTLRWTITSPSCGSSASTMQVTVRQAPAITGDPSNTQICAGSPATFTASATGTSPTYTWQYFNGSVWNNVVNGTPTGYTYSSSLSGTTSTLTVTPPTNAPNATLAYRLFVSVSGCEAATAASNSATLTVYARPTANAGADQILSCNTFSTTLAGNTPPPPTGTGVWTVVSGAGGSFGNASSPTSTFTGNPSSVYTLRWTVSNGICTSAFDDVNITFNYSLNGIYSVGTGTVSGEAGHFNSLTRAADNYNSCLNGNVTFVLTSTTYNAASGEVFPITFDNNTASNTRTLIIKPNTGGNPTITGSGTTAMIKFNGADYITIDGSNNGTTTQNLTINNTYSDADAAVGIWIASKSTSDGATNDIIKNCKINGLSSGESWAGIVGADDADVQNFADAPNSNNTIQNCTIAKTGAAIVIQGPSAKDQNWQITNNTLGVSSSSDLNSTGVYIDYANNFNITGNNISNIGASSLGFFTNTAGIEVGGNASNFSISNNQISAINSFAFFGALYTSGIQVEGPSQNFTISNNTISNISSSGFFVVASYNTDGILVLGFTGFPVQSYTINNNTISAISGSVGVASVGIDLSGQTSGINVVNQNTINNISQGGGYGAEGILLNATSNSGLSIYNNFIANVRSGGFNGVNFDDNGYGIMINSGSGYKIYYNTVNLLTNQGSVSGSISAALNISSAVTTVGAIDLKDNILANNQTNGGVVAANRYSIYSGRNNNNIFSGNINYNDYYTTGTNLGFIGSNRTTLGDIITGFGGNANSISVAPVFVNASSGDLHLNPANNVNIDNTGTPVTGITTDIDADTRNLSAPDIGADEFNSCGTNLYTWLGGSDNNWNNPSNWCTNNGSVPSITSLVLIPAGTNFQPLISLADANALSITIANGTALTMSGGFNLNLGNGSVFTNNGTFNTSASTGTVRFNGTGTVTGSSATTFKNIITGYLTTGGLIFNTGPTITGNFEIRSGAVTVIAPFYTNTSTLVYNTSGAYTTGLEWNAGASGTNAPGLSIPQNVTVQSGTVSFASTGGTTDRALAGNMSIISGATFLANTRDIYILGNWNNAGTFTPATKKVQFNATAPTIQTISGATTFYDLNLANSVDFTTSTATISNSLSNSTGTMAPGTSTIIFTGTGTTPSMIGSNAKNFYNLQINSGGAAITHNTGLPNSNIHIANSFLNNGTLSEGTGFTVYFDKPSGTETFNGTGTSNLGKLVVGDPSGLSSNITLNGNANFIVNGGGLMFYHNSIYNGSNNTATFSTTPATITGSGTANFYNVITNTSLDFGASPVVPNISNNLTINAGGSVVLHSPIYGAAATLTYNTATPLYNTNYEWFGTATTPGLGVPKNVIIQNTNSVVIAGNRGLEGVLNILTGNKLYLNDKTLTLNGTITGTGQLSGSATSNLVIGATGALGTLYFDQSTDNGTNVLKDMTINSGTAFLANALNITAGTAANTFGTLKVDGTLNTSGFLTLRSKGFSGNTIGDAIVGQSGGTISGNVTVERYIPALRAWRFLGVPFSTTSQSINQAWQEGLTNTTLACPTQFPGTAGYGTEITYNGAGGYDLNTTVNPSIKVWNHTAWTTPTSTTATNLADYKAYCLFVRGDRNICLSQGVGAGSNNTTLRATGVLNELGINGNAITNSFGGLTAGENVFVGNPYASPIDLNLAFANSENGSSGLVNGKFAIWDPAIATGYGVGGYVAVSDGISSPITPKYPNASTAAKIQSGQAFFIYVKGDNNTGSAQFTFKQANKINTQFNAFNVVGATLNPEFMSEARRTGKQPRVYINLLSPAGDNEFLLDGAVAMFDSVYLPGVDDYDAGKKFNFNENIGLKREGKSLAIEARPLPQGWDTLYVRNWLLAAKDYVIQTVPQFVPSQVKEAWLIDNYLKAQYQLSLTDTTNYNFSANADTNSYAGRFLIVFRVERKQVSAIADNGGNNNPKALNTKGDVTVSPNPVTGKQDATLRFKNITKGDYEIEMFNTAGRKVSVRTIVHAGGSSTYPLKINPAWAADKYNIVVVNKVTGEIRTLPLIISR